MTQTGLLPGCFFSKIVFQEIAFQYEGTIFLPYVLRFSATRKRRCWHEHVQPNNFKVAFTIDCVDQRHRFLFSRQTLPDIPMTNLPRILSLFLVALVVCLLATAPCSAQRKRKQNDTTIKGKVTLAGQKLKSWNGDNLKVDLTEIQAKLREYVKLPPPNYPAGHEKWTVQQRREWQEKFAATEAGKRVVARNKKLLEAANSFDLQIERDGSFIIYDVPAGDYAIQGRYDRKVGDTTYAYEVFGKLSVGKDVDEIALAPIRVEITPQYLRGVSAPPFKVTTYNDKSNLELPMFKGRLLMVNFWSAASPVAVKDQKAVQDTIGKISGDENFSVLSINVDKDRKKALKLLNKNKLLKGSHGFTLGSGNPALFNYGIQGVPSYWLIDPKGNVLMNQYEFAKMMKTKDSFATIINDRLKNNEVPTPATRKPTRATQRP